MFFFSVSFSSLLCLIYVEERKERKREQFCFKRERIFLNSFVGFGFIGLANLQCS